LGQVPVCPASRSRTTRALHRAWWHLSSTMVPPRTELRLAAANRWVRAVEGRCEHCFDQLNGDAAEAVLCIECRVVGAERDCADSPVVARGGDDARHLIEREAARSRVCIRGTV